jgi:predicted ABC-type exoprotein transport system permease subunit
MKRLKILMYVISWTTLIALAFIIGAGCVVSSKLMIGIGAFCLIPWVFMCLILAWVYSHLKNKVEDRK